MKDTSKSSSLSMLRFRKCEFRMEALRCRKCEFRIEALRWRKCELRWEAPWCSFIVCSSRLFKDRSFLVVMLGCYSIHRLQKRDEVLPIPCICIKMEAIKSWPLFPHCSFQRLSLARALCISTSYYVVNSTSSAPYAVLVILEPMVVTGYQLVFSRLVALP